MMNGIVSGEEAKAWVKRRNGDGEIIRVITEQQDNVRCYQLFAAYENEYFGCILFDPQNYWIYDGNTLSIDEQEQLAKFIIKWNS